METRFYMALSYKFIEKKIEEKSDNLRKKGLIKQKIAITLYECITVFTN